MHRRLSLFKNFFRPISMWRSTVFPTLLVFGIAGAATAGASVGVYSRIHAWQDNVEILAKLDEPPVAVQNAEPQTELMLAQGAQGEVAQPRRAKEKPDNAGDALEKKLRSARVRLSRSGELPGRINVVDAKTGGVHALTKMTISMLQNGEVKATGKPGVGGVFQITGLQPGVYSLVGAGEDGYIAHGVEILPFAAKEPAVRAARLIRPAGAGISAILASRQVVQDELDIDSLAVPRRDFEAVLRLARSYIPPSLLSAKPGEIPAIAKPGEESDEPLPKDTDPPSTVLRRHAVEIRPDGTLVGRMRRIHPETGKPTRMRRLNVFLIRNNSVVSQSPVSESGTFTCKDITPGDYSFVAAGVEGFSAFTVQLVQSSGVARADDEWIIPVGFMAQEMEFLDGILLDSENVEKAIEYLKDQIDNRDRGGLGGFGGGGAGGAGGGAAGGIGAGAGLGLGAALGGAIAGGIIGGGSNNGSPINSTSLP
jgi:hypothetical protein